MFQVIIDIDFCYGHRLVGHAGKCRFLHGHTGKLTLLFESADLNEEDMVIDFGVAKAKARKWVDENLDHKLLLHEQDPLVPLLHSSGEVFFTLPRRPTAEVIAQHIFTRLTSIGLPLVEVQLSETDSTRAVYKI